ncbi:hypothetical protein ACHAPT_011027 [Fusarium lateritium]
MSSEPITHLRKVLNTFRPASVSDDGTFLPDQSSYPKLFSNGDNGTGMKSALYDATGTDWADFDRIRKETQMTAADLQLTLAEETTRINHDLYQGVQDEFYTMAADLEAAFNSVEKGVDGPDGLVIPTNNLAKLSENERDLLSSATDALASHHKATFDKGEDKELAPALDPQLLVQAFTSVRELKTRVSAVEAALGKLSDLEKADEWNKFNAHKELFSPPYGKNGKILSENLSKVTVWYMSHKRNREILSEAHQNGLAALSEDEFFKSHGCPEWTKYSFEYFRQNPDVFYNLMDTYWLKHLTAVDYWVSEGFKKGLAPFVADIEMAEVVNGQVQYPAKSQDVTVFDKLIKDAYAQDGLSSGYFDQELKLSMTAAMQESLRSAMLRQGNLEDMRKEPSEVFQKLCRCQQASYGAAADLGNGMIHLMNYIDDTMRPDVLTMTSILDDLYCNLIVEDFESAAEDWTTFGSAFAKFQDDLDSFYGMFR